MNIDKGNYVIGVVGNCAAGKTTLVSGLNAQGFSAVNIAQEHSAAPQLWRRKKPDFLVYLSCTLESAKSRRKICWDQGRLDDQWKRLANAKDHCHLYLPTDGMTIEEVMDTVIKAVSNC